MAATPSLTSLPVEHCSVPVLRSIRVMPPKADVTEPLSQAMASSLQPHQQLEVEARTQGCSAAVFYACLLRLTAPGSNMLVLFDPKESVNYYEGGVRSRTSSVTGVCERSLKRVVWQSPTNGDKLHPLNWRFAVAVEEEVNTEGSHLTAQSKLNRVRSHWRFKLPTCTMDLYRWTGAKVEFQIEVDLTVSRASSPASVWWTAFKSAVGQYVLPDHFLLTTESTIQTVDAWLLPTLRRTVLPQFPQCPRTRPMTDAGFKRKLTVNFRVSLKLDGQNEVFVVGFVNGVVALVVNHVTPVEVRYLNVGGGAGPSPVAFVLQGEWMRDLGTVYVFDALVVRGVNAMKESHHSRMDRLLRHDHLEWKSVNSSVPADSLKLLLKPWEPSVELLNRHDEMKHVPHDGYIWMDSSRPYTDMVVFKDKPVKDLTVDVELFNAGDDSVWCVGGHLAPGKGELVDTWSAWSELSRRWANEMGLPSTYWLDLVNTNEHVSVIECELIWDGTDPESRIFPFRLEPVRFRPGKSRGNAWYVIDQTVKALVGEPASVPATVNTLSIEQLRAIHNNVKQRLIDDWTLGCTVLDIGFGKGGDLLKYQHVKPPLTHIYAVEPNVENWNEATSRMAELGRTNPFPFTVLPVQIGTKCQDLVMDQVNMRTTTVCMFFSLAYLWDSEKSVLHWLNLLDRVGSERLVMTFMDQYQLADLTCHHKSPHVVLHRPRGGKQVIEFYWSYIRRALEERESNVYGHPVLVSMVPSQTATKVVEWMVHQPTLFRLLTGRGWTLKLNRLFGEDMCEGALDPWNQLFRKQVWIRNT